MLSMTDITEIRQGSLETNHGTHKLKDVAPIPLTADILLKNGAEKVDDSLLIFKETETERPAFYILISDEKYYLSTEDKKKITIPIESVHQFQNLYYAVRSKDVNIKL